jgi:hypothetical protein
VESMIKQLPQVDFTFGIGDIVGSIALLVSAFTFYISYTQASQSEQIKTSKDIWAGIIVKYNEFREDEFRQLLNDVKLKEEFEDPTIREVASKRKVWQKVWPVFAEIDYFAYLILSGEIKDKVVLKYYHDQIIDIIKTCINRYTSIIKKTYPEGQEGSSKNHIFMTYPHIVKLLEKWDVKDFKEEIASWRSYQKRLEESSIKQESGEGF